MIRVLWVDPLEVETKEYLISSDDLEPIDCPRCQGRKKQHVYLYFRGRKSWKWGPCELCNGQGFLLSIRKGRIRLG